MSVPNSILLATENFAKAAEISAVFSKLVGQKITILTLRDLDTVIEFPDEIGSSFCEIATAKALAAMTSSGLPSIGDDSGLCVDALEGAPGIKSRRWAGELNDDSARNEALIKALQPFPDKRTASFITCAALCIPGQKSVDAVGECRGTIVDVPRGENGFGYDPIFEVAGLGSTMAELTQAEKNSVSHRARAIGSLIAKLGWIDG